MSRFFKTPFTLSTVAAIALVALIIGVLAGRLFAPTSTSANANAPASSNRVDVIVKATDSQFWQAMLAGSQAAGKDWGVQVGLFGATSEADVSAQVGMALSEPTIPKQALKPPTGLERSYRRKVSRPDRYSLNLPSLVSRRLSTVTLGLSMS